MPNSDIGREKRIDLATSAGAGLLGSGIGILLGNWIQPAGVPLLLAGAALHGWGMLERHQRERATGTQLPAWSVGLFWLCWVSLIALGVYLVVR